jgi:hypothetical protein
VLERLTGAALSLRERGRAEQEAFRGEVRRACLFDGIFRLLP